MYYYDKTKEAIIGGMTANPRNPQQRQFITDYNFSRRTDIYLSTMHARNALPN